MRQQRGEVTATELVAVQVPAPILSSVQWFRSAVHNKSVNSQVCELHQHSERGWQLARELVSGAKMPASHTISVPILTYYGITLTGISAP